MACRIPNRVMQSSNRIPRLDPQHLPDATAAMALYNQEGGIYTVFQIWSTVWL